MAGIIPWARVKDWVKNEKLEKEAEDQYSFISSSWLQKLIYTAVSQFRTIHSPFFPSMVYYIPLNFEPQQNFSSL